MKKLLVLAMVLSSIIYVSCTKSEEGDEDKLGSIYGIVTEIGTAEPMKAIGVELYKKDAGSSRYALLLKTVTFDDGHFEFKDLNPNNYQVKVVADGYEQIEEGYIAVEAGRQARIDLQVKSTKLFSIPSVVTLYPSDISSTSATLNGRIESEGYPVYNERGFVYSERDSFADDEGFEEKVENGSFYNRITWLPVSGRSKEFSTNISSLTRNHTYFVRAYAKYEGGTVYGKAIEFIAEDWD